MFASFNNHGLDVPTLRQVIVHIFLRYPSQVLYILGSTLPYVRLIVCLDTISGMAFASCRVGHRVSVPVHAKLKCIQMA